MARLIMRSVDRFYLTHVYVKMAMAGGAKGMGSMAGGMGQVMGGVGGMGAGRAMGSNLMRGTGTMQAAGASKAPGMGGLGVAKALGQGSGRHGSLTGGGVMGPGGGFKNTAQPGVPGPLAGGRPTVNIQPKAQAVTQRASPPAMTRQQALQNGGFQNTAAQPGMLRPMPNTGQAAPAQAAPMQVAPRI
jgi:hypothetical protein